MKIEPGRDRAANQRPVSKAFRRLPNVRRHDRLRLLAAVQIRAEREALDRPLPAHREFEPQWRACVEVPHLGGIDPVPVRALAPRQQEIDGCRSRLAAGLGEAAGGAVGLTKEPTFQRLWLEAERGNESFGQKTALRQVLRSSDSCVIQLSPESDIQ